MPAVELPLDVPLEVVPDPGDRRTHRPRHLTLEIRVQMIRTRRKVACSRCTRRRIGYRINASALAGLGIVESPTLCASCASVEVRDR